jgi:hypothetical protein
MHPKKKLSAPQTPFLSHAVMPIENLSVHELGDRLLLDDGVLILIAANVEVRLTELLALHLAEERLVVGDDQKLEVGLLSTILDQHMEGSSQSLNIVAIQVCGWFI